MAVSWTDSRRADALLIELSADGAPVHRQIEESLRQAIRGGRLQRGTALPASRRLAEDLGVSRGVVVEAYQQLVAEGYLVSRIGSYTRVALGAEPQAAAAPASVADDVAIDFCPCRADGAMFPRKAWLRSTRRVLLEATPAELGYVSSRGVAQLHEVLSSYLNRVRATAATPGNVVVCNGYGQGIALVIQALVARGARRVAVEDPCADDDAVPLARAAGLEVVGVGVGRDGIRVAELQRLDADALILTPSHQWPTGGVLSAASRSAVARWARERQAFVVEDDYDAEYRYDRAPIGALQGLAPDRVIYAGTASKTLAPGLRLGWLVVPSELLAGVVEAKRLADRGSPVLDQLTFADFVDNGELDRHLRRTRPVYRRRRDALLAALRARLPELEPAGVAAGLHLMAHLPDWLDEARLIAAARARGVALHGLAPYYLSGAGRSGLVFGYATLDEATISAGIDLVADAVAELRAAA